MIGIVDYGVGNVLAFANVYKRMNIPFTIVSSAADVAHAEKLILPGVGSFDYAMSRLIASGLRDALDRAVLENGVSVLGICVGMQMLAESSDEGELPGLNWVPGNVRKMTAEEKGHKIRLPHMGWNNLTVSRDSLLLSKLGPDSWFYYLHSYRFACEDPAHELASCEYGDRFSCAVSRDNVFGVQFHPEKSHDYGARLLRNFAEI